MCSRCSPLFCSKIACTLWVALSLATPPELPGHQVHLVTPCHLLCTAVNVSCCQHWVNVPYCQLVKTFGSGLTPHICCPVPSFLSPHPPFPLRPKGWEEGYEEGQGHCWLSCQLPSTRLSGSPLTTTHTWPLQVTGRDSIPLPVFSRLLAHRLVPREPFH